jgi:hypothetical protein
LKTFKRYKTIFNLKLTFTINKIDGAESLIESIEPYKDFQPSENSSVFVNFINPNDFEQILLSNKREEIDLINHVNCSILIKKESKEVCKVFFCLKPTNTIFHKIFQKIKSKNFYSRTQNTGFVFSEIVLPAILIRTNSHLLIHSSSLSLMGKGITLCGDSGSGKSSLLLKLLKHRESKFISDDITAINNEIAFFNCSPIKVYDYNKFLINNIWLKLFSKKTIVEKLHYSNYKLFGSTPRLLVNPENNFITVDEEKIEFIFFLKKVSTVDKLTLKNLNKDEALDLAKEITLKDFENLPKSLVNLLKDNFETKFKKELATCKFNLIEIPIAMEHKDFVKEASAKIVNQIN